MNKIILLLSLLLSTSLLQAATVSFICPNDKTMRQGTSCAPDAGCHPNGITFKTTDKFYKANIDPAGIVFVDDEFIGKEIYMKTGDNFWIPSYCDGVSSGYLDAHFTLKPNHQTISVIFHDHRE